MYICKDCVPGGCHALGIATEIPFCSMAASGSCDTSTYLAAIVQNIYPAKTWDLPGTRTFQYVKLEQQIQTFKYRLKFRFLCQVKSD